MEQKEQEVLKLDQLVSSMSADVKNADLDKAALLKVHYIVAVFCRNIWMNWNQLKRA